MFREDFVWGVATSGYQVEGHTPDDGSGVCMWDVFCDEGRVPQNANTRLTVDEMHRYPQDFELMRLMGVKNYRFSLNWSRILPEGTGRVNEKGIQFYREMISCMLDNGITPYITLYHWELPEALNLRGGWMNREIVEWFGEYAKVVAENLSDLCDHFITLNEPQCSTMLGYSLGEHAPGLKVNRKETFIVAHNLLMAHGQAVINLRKYSCRPVQIGFSPTCGVAIPATDTPEDIEAAREVYFGFYGSDERWAWNVSWFVDPVIFGRYPEEGLKKFKDYLPEFKEEDMKLINQPLDFLGQNIYNGYPVHRAEDGSIEFPEMEWGYSHNDCDWPTNSESLYWGAKFTAQRYPIPLYITENGIATHDRVSADGRVHDADRIAFLDDYIGVLQQVADEGADIRGYFLWTFLDNFEWAEGYRKRFGTIYVDFQTQQRIAKDSAYWYKEVMETNGANLSVNSHPSGLIFIKPSFSHTIWGGSTLRDEFGYDEPGDDIGECWGISAHPQGDDEVLNGFYEGIRLSELWDKKKEIFGNAEGDRFPLLTKIISAKEDLSIQVHPNDEYAGIHENGSLGKMECWYILDAEPGSKLVVGHNAKTKEELADMIDNGRWNDLIRHVDIKPGDFIQIDPGTVHAICGGVTLLETQQSSDITYRLYDYDRLSNGKPRPLHLSQSKDVIMVPSPEASSMVVHDDSDEDIIRLIRCRYYEVYRIRCNGDLKAEFDRPFMLMSVVEGSGVIDSHPVKKGDHFIVPAGYGKIGMLGDMKIIASCLPGED
ncbi:MAG: beta-glucosidase [Lachnospiraceae bacterium]|nr:beta-glucosidase [Lachnospiraceae bacterium]